MQDGDPVQMVQSHHGTRDALLAASFVNRGDQPIVSYRIGWAIVKDGKTSLHEGPLMNVPGQIASGSTAEVPDQAVKFDTDARVYMFYVAEVTYADGTTWAATAKPLITQAEGRVLPESTP